MQQTSTGNFPQPCDSHPHFYETLSSSATAVIWETKPRKMEGLILFPTKDSALT